MKIKYTLFIIFLFTVSTFAQINNSKLLKVEKSRTNYFYFSKITHPTLSDFTNNQNAIKYHLYKNYKKNYFLNSYDFKIIPIPPATSSNSKSELLPLFRPENFAVEFLKKPIEKSNIIFSR